jgi:hypothetical protein
MAIASLSQSGNLPGAPRAALFYGAYGAKLSCRPRRPAKRSGARRAGKKAALRAWVL